MRARQGARLRARARQGSDRARGATLRAAGLASARGSEPQHGAERLVNWLREAPSVGRGRRVVLARVADTVRARAQDCERQGQAEHAAGPAG